MSLVFNMVGGGGAAGGAELPAIYVTYPAGSVCTCTNGSKTFTAKDTTGFWLFAGLEVGSWTVTATDGTETATKTVEITSEGQVESVELSYELYLYNYGDQCVDVTGGWATYHVTAGSYIRFESNYIAMGESASSGRTATFGTVNKIDVTNYDTLKIVAEIDAGTNSVYVGVSDNKTSNKPEIAAKWIQNASKDTPIAVDISNVTGEHYIKSDGGVGTQKYYEFWLE